MVKIKVENLTKIFGPHPAKALELLKKGKDKEEIFAKTRHAVGLAKASFEVHQGETLVVMGLSGSGKSTLIRCLNRLIEPTTGKIQIDGQEITRLEHNDLLSLRRRKFGMVFQNFALFPHRTVLRNVEYGLEIQGEDMEKREQAAREALKLVGLEGWEESFPSELSGGMQQRVGLARALAVEPDILLMDEAFSALDPLIRRDMQDELISLQERVKKTIVFITHDLDEAVKIGDRIILMKDGFIIQQGTPEEILTRPANGYVEKFVEDVDLSKALTASAVMIRARAVAFPGDGPRTVLRKMRQESISSIFVTQKDYKLLGFVTAEQASEAIKKGDKSIESIIQRPQSMVAPEEPVSTLINYLAETPLPVPVLNQEEKLMGIVVRGSLLAGLAEGGAE